MDCYFDNSATTKPIPEAVEAMTAALTTEYGNPSSLHRAGDAANVLLESSRKKLAAALGCQPAEVYFTSGGTESNNIAIMGAAHAMRRVGKRVVTTSIEHPSVLECMKALEAEGFEVVKLSVSDDGCVKKEDLKEAITEDTILVSMMLVNNEVGSIQPVEYAAEIIRTNRFHTILHTDAVQAFGKLPINVGRLGADLVTVSGHKIHGPKGIGVLYAGRGVRLVPYVLGGGQESGIRSGTQNMPGIAGLAAAVTNLGDLDANSEYVSELKADLKKQLSGLNNLVVNSPEGFPYILNISLVGIPAEVLRNFLSECGVCVSTGSACAKGHRSHVLTAMGLDVKTIDSAIRISFSRFNTPDEVKYLAECLVRANKSLRKTI